MGRKTVSKMSDWSIQLEEDFWDTANKVIGGCEYFGQFMQEMEPHRDWLGTHNNAEYADMLREAWNDYWSDKQ
jgi:hypothetical protein